MINTLSRINEKIYFISWFVLSKLNITIIVELCTCLSQMLCPTGIDISTWSSTSSVPKQRINRYSGHIPSNLFTLNDLQDCTQAYNWLMEKFVQQESECTVCGSNPWICVTKADSGSVKDKRIVLLLYQGFITPTWTTMTS